MLVVGSEFPPWWPFLVTSYAHNSPTYSLVVVHTRELSARDRRTAAAGSHVRYVHIGLDALMRRFVDKVGAPAAAVRAKFASGKGLSDLKPFYGHVFADALPESEYTHWGWVDWDVTLGNLSSTVPERLLWEYDALTFPGATLGFAWAGQLSILRNDARGRTVYEVVPGYAALGFKTGAGEGRQSGWEERRLLAETLRARPTFSILFHMAAQLDYKAQWLTWVPFDHYWARGRVWRCAAAPLSRPGRPPLLVHNETAWRRDVAQVVATPHAYYARADGRVCIRWDLDSSPWRCCPHSSGVAYAWKGGTLTPLLLGYPEASSELRAELATHARRASTKTRQRAYDVCQEGAFFHAGLKPLAGSTPCERGTWLLTDDIGRFSGTLESVCPTAA